MVLSCSLSIICGALAPFRLACTSFHIFSSSSISVCSSAVFLPSAAVRTITPKFLGFMLSTIRCRRLRSSAECILRDIATTSLKGVTTTKRPGSDISQLRRGPLEDIGSFSICTTISGLPVNTSVIFPAFCISGSFLNLPKSSPQGVLPSTPCLLNLMSDLR